MSVWRKYLFLGDVFHNDDLTFEQRRDEIVKRIVKLQASFPNDNVLQDLTYGLGEAEDRDEFDFEWGDFYDWADIHRVWIETIASEMRGPIQWVS